MNAGRHLLLGAAVGAVAGVAPDAALALFGWRRGWLPESHALVRLHRYLHSPGSVIVAAAASGWLSHVLADRVTPHRTGPR